MEITLIHTKCKQTTSRARVWDKELSPRFVPVLPGLTYSEIIIFAFNNIWSLVLIVRIYSKLFHGPYKTYTFKTERIDTYHRRRNKYISIQTNAHYVFIYFKLIRQLISLVTKSHWIFIPGFLQLFQRRNTWQIQKFWRNTFLGWVIHHSKYENKKYHKESSWKTEVKKWLFWHICVLLSSTRPEVIQWLTFIYMF